MRNFRSSGIFTTDIQNQPSENGYDEKLREQSQKFSIVKFGTRLVREKLGELHNNSVFRS